MRAIAACGRNGEPRYFGWMLTTVCPVGGRRQISERIREVGARSGNRRFGGASPQKRCAFFGLSGADVLRAKTYGFGNSIPIKTLDIQAPCKARRGEPEGDQKRREQRGTLRIEGTEAAGVSLTAVVFMAKPLGSLSRSPPDSAGLGLDRHD